MATDRPSIAPDLLADLCRRWKIREFALFGSILRDDFSPESDVDVLVDFEADHPWSGFDLVDLLDELERAFGRRVDLVTKKGLRNPVRREVILNARRVLFAA
jgi:hypothetical protein